MATQTNNDALLLGKMQGKAKIGVEMMAGVRAELLPNPVNVALSTLGGRMTARVILSLFRNKATITYQKHRIDILASAVTRAMPAGQEKVTLVDAPSALSPLAINLATRHPKATVLDIDLREIIMDKRRRLEKGRGVAIPPNLKLLEGDFRRTPLDQILTANGHPKIDVISFLASPFSLDELVRIGCYLRGLLTDNGAVVSFGSWKPAVQEEQTANRLFQRQIQMEWKGIFQTFEQPVEIFKQAGFSDVRVYHPSELARDFGISEDIYDFEIFIVARR